jgi:hypothetical protein
MSDESLRAISLDDFVHYRSAHAYVTEVDEAIDEVEALIGDGFPDAAIELAEFALDLLEEAITMVDDSDGGVGATIRRAEEVHLAACQAGNPDRIALAERLATRALAGDWEIFAGRRLPLARRPSRRRPGAALGQLRRVAFARHLPAVA